MYDIDSRFYELQLDMGDKIAEANKMTEEVKLVVDVMRQEMVKPSFSPQELSKQLTKIT